MAEEEWLLFENENYSDLLLLLECFRIFSLLDQKLSFSAQCQISRHLYLREEIERGTHTQREKERERERERTFVKYLQQAEDRS